MNITLNIRYITRARSSEKYLQNNTAYALGTQTVLEIFENDNIVFVPLKEKIYIAIYLLVHKTNLSDTARIFVNDFLEKYTPEKLFD